jgi:hypothetical protein
MSHQLPLTSKKVRVDLLHPTFVARLDALLNGEFNGRAKICSGVRSFADQLYFWNGYQNKLAGKAGYSHFNLAANPHRKYGGGQWQGSAHMQQPFDNYGHACDIRLSGGLTWEKFVPVAKEYGVCQTVFRPQYEPWHYQWRNSNGIFQAPAMTGEKSESKSVKKTKVDLKAVAAAIAILGEQVARRPLKRGSRNSAVKVVQERLAAKGYKCGFPDGVWGRKTDKACRQYQRDNGLVVDAIVGIKTWTKLLK